MRTTIPIALVALAASAVAPAGAQVRLVPPSGPPPVVLRGHALGISSISVSTDGRFVLTGGLDGTVRWWMVPGTEATVLRPNRGEVYAVALAPSGKQFAFASGDLSVVIADMASGTRHHAFDVAPAWCSAVTWSPDGSRLAAGCSDGKVRIWDSRSGNPVREIARARGAAGVSWSPDGRFVHTAAGAFSVETGSLERKLPAAMAGARTVARSSAGVAGSVTTTDKVIRLVDAGADSARTIIPKGFAIRTDTGWLDVPTMRLAQTAIAFSPDGAHLVTGGADRVVRIWDVKSGNLLATLFGHVMTVTGVAFLDGERLASVSLDGTVRIWEADTYIRNRLKTP